MGYWDAPGGVHKDSELGRVDNLRTLFETQAKLQASLGYDISSMDTETRTAYIKEYVLHCEDEMHEMLRELPYLKPWKKYPDTEAAQNIMYAKARKEWIDALHFFLNISLALGFTAGELFSMYCIKNGINYDRQQDTQNYKKCLEE